MQSRRGFLFQAAALASLSAVVLTSGRLRQAMAADAAPAETFEVQHSDEQWHQLLNDDEFDVLRRAGTERPFTSPLNNEHRAGKFACAGCQLQLFSSNAKFDSGTGWPSFTAPLTGAVNVSRDSSLGMERNEVHCHRCGGHLGHVFDDGPAPTGLRYCMNGVAMRFVAGTA
ncbi:peptide-methionine (R)-S-oxide reductase MsrB [Pseudomonas sp.]|uniref:peptide-methionine (R)-S-oxide reductase MsrB n=1 Tax=Pseudomonas sp. TaxID=306 RepID=UPI003CC50D6A